MRVFFIALVASLVVHGAYGSNKHETHRPQKHTTIIFTGDILLDRGVRQVIERHGADHLFSRDVDSVLRQSQVVVGNLECPATHIKAPVQKRFIFRGEPEWLSVLKKHGFSHLNLANNHTIDQGREGLLDTQRNILKAGMTAVGAGCNMNEASQPVLLTNYPRKVWLVASLRLALENFSYLPEKPCVSQEPFDSLLMRVHTIKRQDPQAVVIVSLHWGGEHTLQPVPSQRLQAHQLIQAGADVLICHHTHTLQTIERYRGYDIYYSIGNFIFDPTKPLNAKACMVKVDITKDSISTTPIPIYIKHCVPCIIR